ncbi:phage holin family protein [Okeania sp. KiyG1]|uniref:phage holin family protein n=1 Tax=Okeania sp. KiyG1 TaxID=2720165 RepID=UPI001922155A|nr:phage holin family protein [Okeania sp. KiyG1]GFZ97275.1 membrane protein [Okeania sp. KiyG1]
MSIVELLILWFVTALSLFIISKLPTGVEIDDFNIALISSGVFGLLNALARPLLVTLALPIKFVLSEDLFILLMNIAIFGLAAWFVTGFRLRWGFWSALIGALALGFINSILYKLLNQVLVS